jgi:hypothetical protein
MLFWSASYIRFLWQIRQNPKMKAILPILLCATATSPCGRLCAQTVAAAGTPAPAQPAAAAASAIDTSGDALVHRVLASVDAQKSIAAKLRQKIDILGQSMSGTGIYLQQGRGPTRQLRLEMELQRSPRPTRVQEVCDSSALWIFEDFGSAQSFARVDMARLRRARPKSPAPPSMSAWFALGGLPKLLASLEGSFRFGPVAESRMDAMRVWSLQGQWSPSRPAELLPDQRPAITSGAAVDLGKLAPNVPDRVVLHVGCGDLFPYRIEYWRADAESKNPVPANRGHLMAVMELYEVRLGGLIDPRMFAYPATSAAAVDRTAAYLDKLGLVEVDPGEANKQPPPRRQND